MSSPMHDNTAPEPADLALARGGDHEAFARLYDRHAAVVLSLCRSRLPRTSRSDADDACQETFIRAFGRLEQVEDAGKLRSWLYAIARRVCSERTRAAMRRRKHEMIVSLNHIPTARDEQAPLEHSQHRETCDRLGAALARLPEPEQLAIHLYYLDPNPVAAARDALGLSRSGFYKLLNRARDQLGDMLAERKPVTSG